MIFYTYITRIKLVYAKKLTISIDETVYYNLYSIIGERKISKFIENIVKPYLIKEQLKASCQGIAQDTQREKEAHDSGQKV
ncbi:hypothetical protein RAS_02280 [Rickettsia asiatica]|uniref:Addiction module antitoxin n=1 Tax=Rickettsia asiatica TaxID=238800 RepID=A0A510GB48_9RICK|nr:hypothetical protein [Rickettsia asiatica]BBJ31119.1 hypothetical protein RAS_02280 [Rickettsia asiatica]